jgi:flagellar hook-length control protein FliK
MLETPLAPPPKSSAQTAPSGGTRPAAAGGAADFSSRLQEALEPATPEALPNSNSAAPETPAIGTAEADTPASVPTDAPGAAAMVATSGPQDMLGLSALPVAAPILPGVLPAAGNTDSGPAPGMMIGQSGAEQPLALSLAAATAPAAGPEAAATPDKPSQAPSSGMESLTAKPGQALPPKAETLSSTLGQDPPIVAGTPGATSGIMGAGQASSPMTPPAGVAPSVAAAAAQKIELAAQAMQAGSKVDPQEVLATAPVVAQTISRDSPTPAALAAKVVQRVTDLTAEGAKPTDPSILLARAIAAATAAREAGQETAQLTLAEPALRLTAQEARLAAPQPVVNQAQHEVPEGQTPLLAAMDIAPRPADTPLPSQAARDAAPPPPTRQLAPVLVSMALGRGEDTLTIALDPVELGRVEVSISHGKEAGQVRIVAERPETLALLQRDQRELDRALSQAGLGDLGRSIAFSLASDQGRQQQQNGSQEKGKRGMGLVQGPEGDRPVAPIPLPSRTSTSLIDLAV